MSPFRSFAMTAWAACVLPLGAVGAQSAPDLNAPRRAAGQAAAATDARLAAQTGQQVKGAAPQPAAQAAGQPAAGKPAAPQSGPGAAPGASAGPPPSREYVMPSVSREVFRYEAEGRRDPFFSLILTEDLRPLLSDLRLVGILYAGAGGRSVAIMRDLQTNAQYRVNSGMTLGRMRVTQIKPRAVIFTIEEFGLSRQDSLFLADTSKTRIR